MTHDTFRLDLGREPRCELMPPPKAPLAILRRGPGFGRARSGAVRRKTRFMRRLQSRIANNRKSQEGTCAVRSDFQPSTLVTFALTRQKPVSCV